MTSTPNSTNLEVPIWIQEGFIRDDIARDHVARYPDCRCLRTYVTPNVGDRTFTELRTTGNDSIIMVGTVTWIGALPSNLAGSGSRYWAMAAGVLTSETAQQTLSRIYSVLGSLHGQRLVGVSSLAEQSGQITDVLIVYVFDDNMLNAWTVEALCVVDYTTLLTWQEWD